MKFLNLLINPFFINFYIYINMFKNLSTKYYQENKKRLLEKPCETYQNQNLSKEEKEKK